RHAPAAVGPIPRLAAIWRLDRPAADSRSTSRILRMCNLCWAIPTPLEKGEVRLICGSPNGVHHALHSPVALVAIDRNRWSSSTGNGGRLQPEIPVAIARSAHTSLYFQGVKCNHIDKIVTETHSMKWMSSGLRAPV